MFLAEEDYIVASNVALNVLQQCSEEKRETAERMAIEEVSGYLRSRYDVKKIFAATGSERNERYELALKWLEGVQAGKIIPDLPTVTGEDGEEDVNNPVKWGSGIQNTYIW